MELTIGQASVETDVKVTTIRFYEERGMLPAPPRTQSGRRMYGSDLVDRLKFIKHARALGFDLDDIAALLALSDDPEQTCNAADSMARKQLASVKARIAQLNGLRAELERMIDSCGGGSVAECKVIETLADHAHCAHPRHDVP
ncbi:DNA-binding transcriptional regulator, MerR family [Cognatiyoonia koreensis]|uniref:DNA-binding transcriptional regulator, MerR family n=1 Tax=Cognatiyoonia koreensis TaxID=364200 RepID=A0A1I0NAP5_9RHOB|nr:helix-turn-helix domain-containing protein [Cognatiyoonia koreensis]SEV98361.1 DNA-binding transcriptional regulator, MerR family [Cognatiyoonia koreensis]